MSASRLPHGNEQSDPVEHPAAPSSRMTNERPSVKLSQVYKDSQVIVGALESRLSALLSEAEGGVYVEFRSHALAFKPNEKKKC